MRYSLIQPLTGIIAELRCRSINIQQVTVGLYLRIVYYTQYVDILTDRNTRGYSVSYIVGSTYIVSLRSSHFLRDHRKRIFSP